MGGKTGDTGLLRVEGAVEARWPATVMGAGQDIAVRAGVRSNPAYCSVAASASGLFTIRMTHACGNTLGDGDYGPEKSRSSWQTRSHALHELLPFSAFKWWNELPSCAIRNVFVSNPGISMPVAKNMPIILLSRWTQALI